MAGVLAFLQGKKTHLLVLVAVVMVLAGVGDPQALELNLGDIDADRLMKAILLSMVSTIKAGFNRSSS